VVQSQPGQTVHKTLSRKYPSQKGLMEWLKMKALSSSPRTMKNNNNNKMFFVVRLKGKRNRLKQL
jgi:hypothetical protein